MAKKADLSMQTIVVAILCLVVLVILIFVFKGQIGNSSKGYFTIGNDAISGASGKKCQTLMGGRYCETKAKELKDDEYIKQTLPTPLCTSEEQDKITNCKDKKCIPCDVWIDCFKDSKLSRFEKGNYEGCVEVTKK